MNSKKALFLSKPAMIVTLLGGSALFANQTQFSTIGLETIQATQEATEITEEHNQQQYVSEIVSILNTIMKICSLDGVQPTESPESLPPIGMCKMACQHQLSEAFERSEEEDVKSVKAKWTAFCEQIQAEDSSH